MKDLKLFNCKNMKKLSLFFMAAFMTLMASAQGKPAVEHYQINGMQLEGMNGKLALTKESLPKLMQGVVCYPYLDRGEVSLEAIVWEDNPNYVLVLLKVEYPNTKRAREQYVATYGHKSGVIDAVLAVVDGDVTYLAAPYRYNSDSNYSISHEHSKVQRTDTGFVVKRAYQSRVVFSREKQTEHGTWSWPYLVDESGKIFMRPSDWDVMIVYEPILGPGERARVTHTRIKHSEAIDDNLIMFLMPYSTPLSVDDEFGYVSRAYELTVKILDLGQDEFRKPTFEKLRKHTNLWQKHLMYRRPLQWAECLYKDPRSYCWVGLTNIINADAEFVTWFKAQVKKLKDKEMRKWWEQRMARW